MKVITHLGVWALLTSALSPAQGVGQVPQNLGVSVIHIPEADTAQVQEALIRKYLLRPEYRKSPYYIFKADTTALPLLQGPGYGMYYTGQGRTSHTPGRYRVVYVFKRDILLVNDSNSLHAHNKVMKWLFQAVGLPAVSPERNRVKAEVAGMLKRNKLKIDSGMF